MPKAGCAGKQRRFDLNPYASRRQPGNLNVGNDTVCASIGNKDQRNYNRPVGTHCDMGAVEAGGRITHSNTHSHEHADPHSNCYADKHTETAHCHADADQYANSYAFCNKHTDQHVQSHHCTRRTRALKPKKNATVKKVFAQVGSGKTT